MVQAKAYDFAGKDTLIFQWFVELSPTSVQKIESIKRVIDKLFSNYGGFLSLRLLDTSHKILDDNLYWLPDTKGNYNGLQRMQKVNLIVVARKVKDGRIAVKLNNPLGSPLAFFNRISIVNKVTKKRILPVFYSDNYVSVLPGEEKIVFIDYNRNDKVNNTLISISGWNVDDQYVEIKRKP